VSPHDEDELHEPGACPPGVLEELQREAVEELLISVQPAADLATGRIVVAVFGPLASFACSGATLEAALQLAFAHYREIRRRRFAFSN
jgi:hypothetical protein